MRLPEVYVKGNNVSCALLSQDGELADAGIDQIPTGAGGDS